MDDTGLDFVCLPAITVKTAAAGLGKLALTLAELSAAASATDDHPTAAQAEAGNYRKGKITVHGLTVSIENPKGSTRSGTDKAGKKWSVVMSAHYGYFNRTEGRDGDPVDCFVGDDLDTDNVYVVNQVDPAGKFDEHKVMLCFADALSAGEAYLSSYEKGWKGLGSVKRFTIEEFKKWILEGDHGKKARAGNG